MIVDERYRTKIVAKHGGYKHLSDEDFLKKMYYARMGKRLDLNNPQTYNEKLQWLKLYDRKPEYTKLVDKYEVKKFVVDRIGKEHVIPTLGVWDSFEQIDFDSLPKQFVLKCTHDSGGLFICTDKDKLDIEVARKKINQSLRRNFYYFGREWPYKNVKPRIIAEKYMVDESGYELKDYKFFCFDGVPKALFIATDRQLKDEDTKFDFYDAEFNHIPVVNGHPNAYKEIKKPESFEEMKRLASILSVNIPHVRVDLYDINGHIYFGELTFYHFSGMVPFEPDEWDYTFGSWINLPNKKRQ